MSYSNQMCFPSVIKIKLYLTMKSTVVILALACAVATSVAPSPVASNGRMPDCVKALMSKSIQVEMRDGMNACMSELHFTQVFSASGDGSHPDPVIFKEKLKKLQVCIAGKMGYVAADGSFDVDAFKGSIARRAVGSGEEAKIKRGLDSCPTEPLSNFKIHQYMACLATNCDAA
ncbi:uncharacterized protein LOC108682288 [Hyalella azteca]|uniref:Uncharacterized protein LOC108682288 n=1 Tax=Hyalella azteca TaxID=294128 RepID=A0A8B7PL52_HYAAZ|nr:uncharacterized protein LOC108682288 [Hyalella azteca]